MKALRLLFSLFLLAVFVQAASAQDSSPDLLNVQGLVVDDIGVLLDGQYELTFALYTLQVGGSPLRIQTLPVLIIGGNFNVSIEVEDVPFDVPYWFGLSIDGGDELEPRLPLYPSPYSFSTRSLFGAENVVPSSGNVGFGTTDPKAQLHTVGDVLFEELTVTSYLGVEGDVQFFGNFLALDGTSDFGLVKVQDLNITGGVLTFPDGSTQSTAGGGGGAFNGMLNNIPLIIKDANGNEVFRVNPDGTSVHEGLERFNGGLVVPVPGVGDISISEFGLIIPLENGGGISITEDGISMIDGNGDEVFRIDPDGTSFHAGLETYAGGITVVDGNGNEVFSVDPDGTSFHAGLETFAGGLVIKDANGNTVVTLDENGVTVDEANKRIKAPATGLRMEGPFHFEDPLIFEDGFESGDTGSWGPTSDVGVDSRTNVTGVRGENVQPNGIGVHGTTNQPNSVGVQGDASDPSSKAGLFNGIVEVNGDAQINGNANIGGTLDAQGDLAVNGNAQVNGNVNIGGTLDANQVTANVKNFRIDHPLDPEGQYLIHTSVESPDMMTVYNGNVTLDADGAATVEMPSYFEALNKDFRYQLTAIGGFAPVYVAEEIADNRFKIGGGTPGMKVSWQVTGVRHDPYAEAYRSPVEVEKPAAEQGTYLHPELYGASPAQHARREGSDQR